jgi:hypothetical protein
MSRRIYFTGQQKIAILREHLVENNWQKILFEEGASLFERKPNASNVRRQEAAAVKQVQEPEAAVTSKNWICREHFLPGPAFLK